MCQKGSHRRDRTGPVPNVVVDGTTNLTGGKSMETEVVMGRLLLVPRSSIETQDYDRKSDTRKQ